MISPVLSEFEKLSRRGNLIAVTASVPADLETPVSSFLKVSENEENAFLLESAEQEEKIGRYSFIGLKPMITLRSHHGETESSANGKISRLKNTGPFINTLEKTLTQFKLANPESLPGFCGGFVGYLSYENVEDFEQIRLTPKKGPDVPDAIFFLTEDLLIFDHFRKTLTAAVLVDIRKNKNLKAAHTKASAKIHQLLAKLRSPLSLPAHPRKSKIKEAKPASNMTPKSFAAKVNRIKEYIRAGDCIQVVLSQRFTLPAVKEDFQIYRALRSINPSPYMFYFRSGNFRLIGSSPEMLVRKEGRNAELRPIAGTRKRGATPGEDAAMEESLRASVKEMAEHLMLVDLGRNDLGRVCQFDSVKVKDFARVERYSHVMHLVSDVEGKLKPGKTAFDLLKATFPAGTVSGAPKIRAMQIINELEPERRGPYAGCLGYFSFNADMDMCITIRTLVLDGKKIYLQAGAGIVKDSSPEKEYEETLNKAKALVKAIAIREDF